MSHSYIAYFDEPGDDGLTGHFRQPGGQGGPSHWLVIGATVWRASRDLDMVRCAKAMSYALPKAKHGKPLHFKELDHSQRKMAITQLRRQPFRFTGVHAYKPIIPPGIYTEKNQFYHYMSRYLIERLSWFCRDFRRHVPEGDGRVKIIFSRRGGMDYDDFQSYLRLLKATHDSEISIHWPVIDIEGVEAYDHGSRFGLQLADLAVSGLRAALEPDAYGNLEPQFAEILKERVYDRAGKYLSYGEKLVPSAERIAAHRQEGVIPADLGPWLKLFDGK